MLQHTVALATFAFPADNLQRMRRLLRILGRLGLLTSLLLFLATAVLWVRSRYCNDRWIVTYYDPHLPPGLTWESGELRKDQVWGLMRDWEAQSIEGRLRLFLTVQFCAVSPVSSLSYWSRHERTSRPPRRIREILG